MQAGNNHEHLKIAVWLESCSYALCETFSGVAWMILIQTRARMAIEKTSLVTKMWAIVETLPLNAAKTIADSPAEASSR